MHLNYNGGILDSCLEQIELIKELIVMHPILLKTLNSFNL